MTGILSACHWPTAADPRIGLCVALRKQQRTVMQMAWQEAHGISRLIENVIGQDIGTTMRHVHNLGV